MAKCPSCEHEVATPSVFNLQAWSGLTCPHCTAKLEVKPRKAYMQLTPFWALALLLSSWFGRLGHNFEVVAGMLLGTMTVILIVLLIFRPEVRLRKPLPKSAVRLGIND